MKKVICEANLILPNNEQVIGLVTTEDDISYLFKNTWSTLDFYFSLKKDQQSNWRFCAGPDYEISQELIYKLGSQIDYAKKDPKIIELIADGFLSTFVPKDPNESNIQFEFLIPPNLNIRAFYGKELGEDKKYLWKFRGSELI
jgi:hypothetical protein